MNNLVDRNVVLIDVDGVLYNFVAEFRNAVMRLTKRHESSLPDATQWSFYKDWDLTSAQFHDLLTCAVNDHRLLRSGMPLPHSVAGWQRLHAIPGLILHVVSDVGCDGCRETAQAHRTYWLNSWGFHADAITYTADKAAVVDGYRNDGWKVYGIEDNPDHYQQMTDTGAEMWLVNYPFNQHIVVPSGRRVRGFGHFSMRLESLLLR